MDASDIQLTAAVEERHWWYRERRAVLARQLRRIGRPGRALDLGAAGGGNTGVLVERGWDALAVDYSEAGVEIARARGLNAVRADARDLPIGSRTCDLVVAFDVLEHIDEDHLAACEIARVLRPGGTALISVPCDMALWSAHDEASGHFRRYGRRDLTGLIEKAGLAVDDLRSWNVLLRPVVALRRRTSTGGDVVDSPALVNAALTAVIRAERYLPVHALPGVSLMLRAHRP
ncbi:bifunctional 2-polyprenyl-6-hydroxyphenol methylase/3-demethylubiquinol 3-O-methyltransferase UbiG [Planomonospora sp. ID82291]|uniref:class I SAM-dependent methyltransferase n=1 Tax=Planomonospora sp. ID82291 TaxID=2738136 RepID=UPI0018C42E79|nr:class I SAM-dependent methyltransferase [Planomonospora sp. ID82291]MBG0813545.1 class I SAM-dependent methyltransferase [Planomonospora sp. ID82291]